MAFASSGGQLTASGNEITDAVRTAGTNGDGLAVPAGVGIWGQRTNLHPNGNGNTNANNWNAILAATVSRDTATSKFGSTCITTTTPNAAVGEGVSADTNTGQALAAGTNVSDGVWLWGSGTVNVNTRITNTDATTTDGAATAVTLTATPTLYTPAVVAVAVGKTGDKVSCRIVTQTQQAATIHAGGLMIVNGPIPLPYCEGTIPACRVQAPASLLNATQFAYAGATAYDQVPTLAQDYVLFGWATPSLSEYIMLTYHGDGNVYVRAKDAAGHNDNFAVAFTPTAGVFQYALAATATQWKLSINGSNFTTFVRTGFPTGLPSMFEIGSIQGASQMDGRIRWAATFTGTLTNTDAATINGYSDTPPADVASLPGYATMLWPAKTTSVLLDAAGFRRFRRFLYQF